MKVLYYYTKLKLGGAEQSTIRLVNKLAQSGHSVTLLLRWDGAMEKAVDSRVRIVHLKRSVPVFRKLGKLGWFLNHGVGMLRMILTYLFVLPLQSYDGAINGILGDNPALLLNHVRAKKYLQMLRNDVKETGSYGKTEQYMQRYGHRIDAYVGVSQYVTDTFKEVYPHLADRAYTVYNILPQVDWKAERPCPDCFDTEGRLRILTVCRLEEKSKGLLRMAEVAKALQEQYPDSFRWYVVGAGPDGDLFRQKLHEYALEQTVILCGAQEDPFAYYAHADLVAVLSYYEGLCGVVNEAKMMHKPVIATRFSAIEEQLANNANGIIVENNQQAIIEAMSRILQTPSLLEKMRCNAMPQKLLDNEEKINDLVWLITGRN